MRLGSNCLGYGGQSDLTANLACHTLSGMVNAFMQLD